MPSQKVIVKLSQHLCTIVSDLGTYILLSWHRILSRLLCHFLILLRPLRHLSPAVSALWVLGSFAWASRVWVLVGFVRASLVWVLKASAPGSLPLVPNASTLGPSPLGVLEACCTLLSPSGSFLLLCKLLPVTSRQLSFRASSTVSRVGDCVSCTLTQPTAETRMSPLPLGSQIVGPAALRFAWPWHP